MIEEIKAEEEMKKARELEEEIKEKWENIDKQQDKQQALNNFINKYKNSKYIEEAEKQLKELQNQNSKARKSIEELSLTNDSKRFKQILEDNKDNLEQNKSFIKDEAIRVFGILKGKKQKNFFKDIQLGRFFGKDFENDVKQSVSGA
jgi:septal ring factor EnvC (AmiA/AmiB activator)